MKDGRCWQAGPPSYLRAESKETVHAAAGDLAYGPVDSDRFWPTKDGTTLRSGFHVTEVREHFIEVVRADSALREAWARHLRERIESLIPNATTDDSAAALVDGSGPNELGEFVQGWRADTLPSETWNTREHHLRFLPRQRVTELAYANVLLHLDPSLGCRALESLVVPTFVLQALNWGDSLSEDRDLLVEVLRVAPPAFDDDGSWNGHIVVLLALEQVVEHAADVDRALQRLQHLSPWHIEMPEANAVAHADAVERLWREEISGWFQLAFAIVLQRRDGLKVLQLLLPRLNAIGLYGGQADRSKTRACSAGIRSLARVLLNSVTTAQLRREWAAQEACLSERGLKTKRELQPEDSESREISPLGEGGRSLRADCVPHLLSALALLRGETPGTDLQATWAWFGECLHRRAPDLERLDDSNAADTLRRQLGALLGRLSSPLESFAETYRKLEPQRRRAEHGYRYREFRGNEESKLCLVAGLFAAETLAREAHRVDSAKALFFMVYAHARRLWLTKGGNDDPERLVAACFAFVHAIFGETLASVLPNLVRPIASEPGLCLAAAANAWVNGVPVDALIALFDRAGVDLIVAAAEEREWWGEDGGPSWFKALDPFILCLGPEQTEARHAMIAARASERATHPEHRAATVLENWLAAEKHVAREAMGRANAGGAVADS